MCWILGPARPLKPLSFLCVEEPPAAFNLRNLYSQERKRFKRKCKSEDSTQCTSTHTGASWDSILQGTCVHRYTAQVRPTPPRPKNSIVIQTIVLTSAGTITRAHTKLKASCARNSHARALSIKVRHICKRLWSGAAQPVYKRLARGKINVCVRGTAYIKSFAGSVCRL